MGTLKKVFLNGVYSLLAIIALFIGFVILIYPIKMLSGPDSDTQLLTKQWLPSIIIFIFPALTCIWANVIKMGSFSLANPATEGFFKKLKIWAFASSVGFVAMLLLEGASALAYKLTQNFGLMLGIRLMATSSAVLLAEAIVFLKLRDKNISSQKDEKPLSNYQKYLKEVEAILTAEKNEIDLVKFEIVSDYVLKVIKSNPEKFEEKITNGKPIRNWTYLMMSSRVGELLESGEYHAHGMYGSLTAWNTFISTV